MIKDEEMLERAKVDHLILLVGGNPLPNAVAGRLLVKENGRVTLIHTNNTKKIAEQLQIWFKAQNIQVNKPRETDRTKKSEIYATIGRTIAEGEEHVGLHYTGGTAAMAVHAHAAIKERASKERGKSPIFSYLDASSLCMNFDDSQPVYVGLYPQFKLTIDDLFQLHGWYCHEKQENVLLPQVVEALYQGYRINNFIANKNPDPPDFIRQTRAWVNHNFNRVGKENGKWKDEGILDGIDAKFPDSNMGVALRASIPSLSSDPDKFSLNSAMGLHFNKIKTFCEWFDGAWFESWVMGQLHQIQAKHDLTEVYTGVRASPDKTPRNGDPEFDVVAMRGYQLFFLSCTITDPKSKGARGILKGKLFEAYVRARQLAGSEVCVALICGIDDADYPDNQPLEAEMQQTLQVEGRVRVFGRKQLPKLHLHLSDWIKEQSRKGKRCP